MKRIVLTDNSGCWFNADSAIEFREKTRWNGNNHISVPTGSQWDHEWLYFTKSGKWVLNEFSNYQGSLESYRQIGDQEAIAWLIQNSHFEDESIGALPEEVKKAVLSGVNSAEI